MVGVLEDLRFKQLPTFAVDGIRTLSQSDVVRLALQNFPKRSWPKLALGGFELAMVRWHVLVFYLEERPLT